jgi:hypothetical protein
LSFGSWRNLKTNGSVNRVITICPAIQAKMRPFYHSMRDLIKLAAGDLGINSEFHVFDHKALGRLARCSNKEVTIFLMSPTVFRQLQIRRGTNPSYLWCFEPLKHTSEHEADAGIEGVGQALTLLGKKKVDGIWVYDKRLCEALGNKQISWAPCGVHDLLSFNTQKQKDQMLMLGNLTGSRERLMTEFNALSSIPMECSVPFTGVRDHLRAIGEYRFTVFYPVMPARKDFVPCHRVMLFAMARVLIFSSMALDPFLEPDVDYVMYSSAQDLYSKYVSLLNKPELVSKMTSSAISKLSSRYKMSGILKQQLGI